MGGFGKTGERRLLTFFLTTCDESERQYRVGKLWFWTFHSCKRELADSMAPARTRPLGSSKEVNTTDFE